VLIVTGFDGSAHGVAALRRADMLATCLQAEHHVVMVAHVSPIEFTAMANPYQVDLYDLETERLETAFDEVKEELATEATPVVVKGNPVLELSAYTEDNDADLLVVGCRGRGAVATMLLGSTSHGVVWRAPCDVLVVRT
jgi:nucleotide-binding universal stress UspA family protein